MNDITVDATTLLVIKHDITLILRGQSWMKPVVCHEGARRLHNAMNARSQSL